MTEANFGYSLTFNLSDDDNDPIPELLPPDSPRYLIQTDPNAATARPNVHPWASKIAAEGPGANPYHPFETKAEYDLVVWHVERNHSLAEIDEYLHMDHVCPLLVSPMCTDVHVDLQVKSSKYSYSSAREMRARLSQMPSGPPWHAVEIRLDEAPNEPQLLFYRDPVQVALYLAANPDFEEDICYEAEEWFEDDGKTRVRHEMYTGDLWSEVQVRRKKIYPCYKADHPVLYSLKSVSATPSLV